MILRKSWPVRGVEDEDGAVDGLGGQVALKGLVDSHAVHIGVVHKPYDLQQCPAVRVRCPSLLVHVNQFTLR